jgi:NAD(P)-dependent dehydrogenase (short-subunit alcohol dehydrogenase family)
MNKLTVITGVGPGTGSAIARRLHSGGYRVAMLARDSDRLGKLEQELEGAFGVTCDVADPFALGNALRTVEDRAGTAPSIVVYNAVAGAFGSFLDITPELLERNFRVNVMALLHLARWAAPKMEAAGGGSLIITGNTSALRGKAKFAGFAPTKAAQRILA